MILSRIYIFIILILVSFSGFAQETGTLSGVVTNVFGEPIPNVNIKRKGSPFVIGTTNEKGIYSLTLPADSSVTLVFTHVSIADFEKKFKLKPGEARVFNPQFNDVTMISDVVIEDRDKRKKFGTTIPIDVVPVQMGPSMDFNRVLVTQLGVSSNNELSSGYSVRGGNFDENLVYVNDIEVYRPFLVRSGEQEGLSFVNGDLVGNIFFSAGGFEAKYGDKMSSVLDITYKKPRAFAGSASASLLGGTVHLEGITESRRLSWLFGARQKSSQYLLTGLDTKGDFKPSFYDVQTFVAFDINDEWELDYLGNLSSNKYHIIPQTRESDFGTVNQALRLTVYWDGQEVDAYRSYMSAFSLINRPAMKNLFLRYIISAFHTQESETFDLLGEYRLDALETDLGKDNFGQIAYNLGIGGFLNHARNYLEATVWSAEHKGSKLIDKDSLHVIGMKFDWGLKFQQEFIHDRLSEWRLIDSSGYSIPQGDPDQVELTDVVKSKIDLLSNRVMGYFQASFVKELKDTSELTVTLGARSNYWDLNNQVLVSPRVTVAWQPKVKTWKPNAKMRDLLFKAAAGYYHQPPFYRELRDLNGVINKDLKAQSSLHVLAGMDFNFKAWSRPFKFVTELYYKHLDHLVPYEVDNVRIRYYAQNLSSGYATGLDFKVNGEFVKGVESWFTMSVMNTKEDIKGDFFYNYYNSDGEKILFGYTTNDTIVDSVRVEPGMVPRPTDQRVTFGIFFQDYLPQFPRCKMHMNLQFGSGLPFGPPSFQRYKDTLRMAPYRRVDIGFSYEIVRDTSKTGKNRFSRHFNSIWISAEVYNLFATNNTISYLWVKDVTDRQYAIPNYLTRRLYNLRLIVRFK